MKIDFVNDHKFIIYLSKLYYSFDKDTIESCLCKILKRIKKIYNIEVYSVFNVECYINDNYGVIFDIEKEHDAFNIYSKKTDLNIKFYNNSLFLYEVDDYFLKNKIDNSQVYIYNKKIYIDIKNNDVVNIIEHTKNIVFGDYIFNILQEGN